MQGKHTRKTVLFVMVFLTSFFYIIWRLLFTLPVNYGVVSMVCGIVLWLSESVTVLETFTHFLNARKVVIPEMPEIPDELYPDVDVLIATHNESADLLFKTVNGCKYMKYPDKSKVHIYLCDDKNRPEIAQLAEEMGIGWMGMEGNQYAKAGNINNGLAQTHSPLVAIFDADMIPTSDFLLETVPYFFRREMILDNGVWRRRTEADGESHEKELGYVQTQQSFYNPDPLQRNLYKEESAPNEQDYFYRAVNVARMSTGSAAFAGSNAVFARKALDDIGGFEVHSITEDFVTGISILGRGYTSIAVAKELAHGLSPEDVYSFIKQRQRWSRGAAQGITNRKFWHSGLPLKAKWNFLVSYFYWWTFVRRFVFIICPILYGLFHIRVADVSFLQLVAVWFPYYVIYNTGLRYMSGGTTSALWSDTIDTVQFPYMIWPIIAGTLMIPQKKFFVTPKDRQSGKNSSIKLATPHIILALLSILTVVVCVHDVIVDHNQGSIIVLYWAVYNLYALINAIIYYFGRNNNRYYERVPVPLEVTIDADGRELSGTTVDLSEGGMAVSLNKPEYIPIDSRVTLGISSKAYKATMEAEVIQVQQSADGRWKYSLKIAEMTLPNREEYLQIIYDRDHFFPRVVDMGIVKDLKNVYKGMTAKARNGERRFPRINMYAPMNSPEAGELYVLNFNYKYILLHGKRALPDTLRLDFTDTIQITCKKERAIEGRGSNTELFEIENWQELALQPDFRDRVMALAAEASKGQVSPEIAELTEQRLKEKAQRKKTIRRRLRIALTLAGAITFYIIFLPDAAREFSAQTGISADTIKAMYTDASDHLKNGDYGEALRSLMDIRGYRNADLKFEDAVDGYRQETLDQAQSLMLSQQYPEALTILREADALLESDTMIEGKLGDVERKYIQDSFVQADQLVTRNGYEEALALLATVEHDLGRTDPDVTKKTAEVFGAYHQHYLALVREQYRQRHLPAALALLDDAQARTGTSAELTALRQRIITAHKEEYLTRAQLALDAGLFDNAVRVLTEAQALYPDEDRFPERIIMVKTIKACTIASAQATRKDFTQAVKTLDAAIAEVGEQPALLAERASIQDAANAAVLRWAFYSGHLQGQWNDTNTLRQTLAALPNDALTQLLYEKDSVQVLYRVSQLTGSGNAAGAIRYLRSLPDPKGDYACLLMELESEYYQDTMDLADFLLEAGNPEGALDVLLSAARVLGDEYDLAAALQRVRLAMLAAKVPPVPDIPATKSIQDALSATIPLPQEQASARLLRRLAYYTIDNSLETAITLLRSTPSPDEAMASNLAALEARYKLQALAHSGALLEAGAHAQAISTLIRAVKLLPGDGDLLRALHAAKEEMVQAHIPAPAENAEPVPVEAPTEAPELQAIDEYLLQGDTESAILALRALEDLDAGLAGKLASVETQHKQTILARVETFMKAAQYDKALGLLSSALGLFPGDAELEGRLQQAEAAKASAQPTMMPTDTPAPKKTPAPAAPAASMGDKQAALAKEKAQMLEALDEYLQRDDVQGAILFLRAQSGLDADLKAQLKALEAQYKQTILAAAGVALEAGQYDDATSMLRGAMDFFPQDASLADRLAEAEAAQAEALAPPPAPEPEAEAAEQAQALPPPLKRTAEDAIIQDVLQRASSLSRVRH